MNVIAEILDGDDDASYVRACDADGSNESQIPSSEEEQNCAH